MNAAFAIGRLCDTDDGCQRLLFLSGSQIMVAVYFVLLITVNNVLH